MLKKFSKLLLIFILTLSMIKPSFINGDSNTKPLTVEVPVKVIGPKGTVTMLPWSKSFKNSSYKPGPALTNPSMLVKNTDNKKFSITFKEPGNYVYEIRQIYDNPNISNDVDIPGVKIYRFYITVIYEDDSHDNLISFMEVESCDDYECTLFDNETPQETLVPTGRTDKPTEVCFENGFWVRYFDGDHGKSDQAGNENKKRPGEQHTPPKKNNVTPNNGYFFEGEYEYVITDEDGKVIETGRIHEDNVSSLFTKGNISLTPIYHPYYWVHYEDGEHGKSDGKGDEIEKRYNDRHNGGNTVTPDDGYRFTGYYEYVITDPDGNIIEKGIIKAEDVTKLRIIGNITLTPLYEPVEAPPIHIIVPNTGVPYLSISFNNGNLLINLKHLILIMFTLLMMLILFIRKKKTIKE